MRSDRACSLPVCVLSHGPRACPEGKGLGAIRLNDNSSYAGTFASMDELTRTQVALVATMPPRDITGWLENLKAFDAPLSPQVAFMLALYPDPGVSAALAASAVPVAAQYALTHSPDRWTRQQLARNTSTSPEIVELLARDAEESVRRRVAARGDLSTEVVAEFLDDVPGVQSALAANALAAQHLERFREIGGEVFASSSANPALDPTEQTRRALLLDHHRFLARNPNLDPGVARALVSADNAPRSLAHNPATPEDVLDALALPTQDPYVLEALARRAVLPRSTQLALLAARPGNFVTDLGSNPSLEPDLLLELHRSWDKLGSISPVARNPSCPPDVLREALESARAPWHFCRSVANDPNLDSGTVKALASHGHASAAQALFANYPWVLDDPRMVRVKMLRKGAPDLLEEALSTTDPGARAVLEPDWPGTLGDLLDTLEELASDHPDAAS